MTFTYTQWRQVRHAPQTWLFINQRLAIHGHTMKMHNQQVFPLSFTHFISSSHRSKSSSFHFFERVNETMHYGKISAQKPTSVAEQSLIVSTL